MTIFALNGQNFEVSAFICDTVRTEADSKITLVGISTGTMQSLVFPVLVPMGIYVQIIPHPPAGTTIDFECKLDDASLFTLPTNNIPDGPPDGLDEPMIQISIDRLMVNIPHPGRFGLYLSLGGSTAERVRSVRFNLTTET